MKKALIVVTSNDALGNTGKKTGYYLPEVSHPYVVLKKAGYDVDFASPLGGTAPMDPGNRDLSDAANAALLSDEKAVTSLKNTLTPVQVDASAYEIIFFAGGMGTMWDFAQDVRLGELAAKVYENGGTIAAVCHGPSALLSAKLSDGSHLLTGRNVAGFSNDEEVAAGHAGYMPYFLETSLKEIGALYSKAPLWQEHVQVSGRLVTGQNPASAYGVAEQAVRVAAQTL